MCVGNRDIFLGFTADEEISEAIDYQSKNTYNGKKENESSFVVSVSSCSQVLGCPFKLRMEVQYII